MKFLSYLIVGLLFCAATGTHAQAARGTWKFERSTEYFGQLKTIRTPKFTTIEVAGDIATMHGCVAKVKREPFFYSDAFQPLLKEGVERPQLDSYLQKTFQFPLATTKEIYTVTSSPGNCHDPIMEFFISGDKLLLPMGGSVFHYYVKAAPGQPRPATPQGTVSGLKTSQLPFNLDDYLDLCVPKIVDRKGVPHTTDKCGPAFFPYAADAKSTNPIVIAIGNHNFEKAGARSAKQFSTPFAHGMHPVILLFPPMQGVVVARVDDFDIGEPESRDPMAAVYVSIKDGKIVDQVGANCAINALYECTDRHGNKIQLTESGRFKKSK